MPITGIPPDPANENDECLRFIFSKTLKEIEKLLPGQSFFRTHHSHLVNLSHVKNYIRGSGGEVVLDNGAHIPVAKSRKEALMERIFPR